MSGTFALNMNDTSPVLRVTATDGADVVVDLTGATAVFKMWDIYTKTVKVAETAAVVEDAAAGVLRYDWKAADVDTAGLYAGRFIVTYPDAKKEGFPNRGNILVEIQE